MEGITKELNGYIDFTYSSFDRLLFRGYITSLFFDGQVVSLLRNMGFKDHSNGVLKLLTDQLNSHIKKRSRTTECKYSLVGYNREGEVSFED
jgi:hypothetical protein